MISIRLPDGSTRSFPAPVTGLDIAESIGKSLAKQAVAIKLDGALVDLMTLVDTQTPSHVEIVTRNSAEGREVIRHDAAHIMAQAALELFPGIQITIGPAIEDGFYYDFAYHTPFTPEDLQKLEDRMREIVKRNEPIRREIWSRDQAITYFRSQGQHYKVELVESIPADEPISVYHQGPFTDICRGPHMPSTSRLGQAFKVTRVSGAYWRGDSRNAVLQRVYGTAWGTQEELDAYLHRLEEAEKRDHRRLGRDMGLFHIQDEAAGSVFWHPKGWTLYRTLENYIRRQLTHTGYVEVKTPQLVDRSLWEASGHWDKFQETMFTIQDEEKHFALKPMNCPCHVQIFRQGLKSYRDLPLRMAEFGSCHRNEPSGSLHGIMRVRAFTQDDAHIFCELHQINQETKAFCELLTKVYQDLGFTSFFVKFSDRPAQRVGSDDVWDRAEQALKDGAEQANLTWTLNPGEGAFYGPKLEFVLRDAIGRDWQCGTLQVDFNMPDRLDAHYIGEDGRKHRPVMLHRAILGSFERFIGVLIEHYAGRFPTWLAPTQVVIATITHEADQYAAEVAQLLQNAGLRVETDLRNEKINYKIRELSLNKIPHILVLGKREADMRTVAWRRLGGEQQTILDLDEAIAQLTFEATPPG